MTPDSSLSGLVQAVAEPGPIEKPVRRTIEGKPLVVSGGLARIARLRHEWCQFIEDPVKSIPLLRGSKIDLLTFVSDIAQADKSYPFYHEPVSVAVLPVNSYQQWWDGLHFKVRNKVRKAEKSKVEIRLVDLDEDFVRGVSIIYNETPIRQGRNFVHYDKPLDELREELRTFEDQCYLVGAYSGGELVGFAKLFRAEKVLRTIHIIATLASRDKCVMDGLIGKAVELCGEYGARYLHYGSWTAGGIGAFREKHGFERFDLPRYYVPITLRGKLLLRLNLHRRLREQLPESWRTKAAAMRTSLRSAVPKR